MRVELADINVLLALIVQDHQMHRAAASWLRSTATIAMCPTTESGLIRLLLNPAVVVRPTTASEALEAARLIRALPRTVFFDDTTSLSESRFRYALTGFRQVTDLHLLTLAHANAAVLATFDARIPAALKPADRRWVKVVA
jgi:toxin-antitoxin system PIN domain toxin